MVSSASVLLVALWLSALGAVVVAGISFSAGAAPAWVVLRAVGVFSALMVVGLVAEAVARHGLAHPLAPKPTNSEEIMERAESAVLVAAGAARETPALEAEVLTAAEAEEESHG